ncbi:MAG TPA: SpoIIE family protein phosphatase [Kofleriaceae bacterium]|nr:SpoIIE family protein phosphatase [Kofleriaceae bacterium]
MGTTAAGFQCALQIAPRRGEGQDRALVMPCDDGVVIALADGAGGISGGAYAAKHVIDAVGKLASHATDWSMLLAELDHEQIGYGQTTAVVLWVSRNKIVGASAGDSAAWVIRPRGIEDVTRGQHTKPLIGDGAIVTAVESGPLAGGTLLVASDGLLRYAKRDDVVRVALGADLEVAARELVELVRLPSGDLPDDVSVILCREAPA